jgi:tRNA A-37 threonylcarbamoyl transferase component Bud32
VTVLGNDFADQVLVKVEPRTLIWSEPLPSGGRKVIKMYRRRHPLDPMRRWIAHFRSEREFGLLSHLYTHDVGCPEPLRWSHGSDRRHGRHDILETGEIPSVMSLHDMLRQHGARALDLAQLFENARRMHECGVAHGAFYARNVLVSASATAPLRFFLVDFAHGRRFRHSIVGSPPADYDLLDMMRSIQRASQIDDRERWLAAYGLGAEDARRLLMRLPRHRLDRPWRHWRRMETDVRSFLRLPGRARKRSSNCS